MEIAESITNKRKDNSIHSKFSHNNNLISDPVEVSNRFCGYFTNIGKNLGYLAERIFDPGISPTSYLQDNICESIFLNPTTKEEIINISKTFKSGKAPGFDGINMTTVKQHIDMICEPFAQYIINLSITTGIVPDNIKVAKVIPIFKKDNPAMFSNYRPISILSIFSKFFERIVYNRIDNFIDKKNILYMHQYGFRKHHSTHLVMLHVVENITSAFDRKEFVMGIFLDLSKAFDTV